VSCEPLSLAAAGVVPAPSTLMVMAEGVCLLRQTRRALYRHWQLADNAEAASVRPMLARAARLVTEITLGRGDAAHLGALDEVALELAAQGLAAAWPLGSSLRHYREQWEQHARRESCPEGLCLERQAAPCHRTCPANIDIPSFIAHIGHGDYRAAIEVIRRDNPLPLTCGLVCPAPCESACVRGGSNGAVFIRPLKAKAAEHCLADGGYPKPEIAPATGKRIGIVGSGPAGLTAAYYLRTFGHEVEILEEQEKAGGMLRYGIPAYRLPPDLLDQELDQIRALGIAIHTSTEVGSLDDFRKNYDAVFLGLGTQRSRLIPIEGVHQSFVLGGIDFLRTVRSGEPVRVGKHVHMVSLEKRREMPASPHEIENAVAEGVQLHPGWGPVRIEQEGETTFQFCEQVHDQSGRFDPQFDAARLLTLEADHVILATGQGTDLTILEGSGVENTHGFILTDPKSLMTKVPGVFAGGDVEHGPRTAVEAIRSGKIAANAIDAWLREAPMDDATGKPVRRADVLPLHVVAGDRTHLPRAVMPERSVEEVLGQGNYVQIEEGLTDAMAHDEARRCLRCDVCIGCGLCMAACSEMGIDALRMADTEAGRLAYFDFTRPAELCIGCGACTQVCPTGAIRIEDKVGLFAGGVLGTGTTDLVRRTIITGTVVREQPLLTCSECGTPTQTPAHREYIRARLPDHMATLLERELCPSCARQRADRPTGSALGRPR
jgi:NADPH-dependent glutamate synthase beta subunit-like oxidoreductase/ferredoxin